LKAPFQLLARPVRAVETMTASVMLILTFHIWIPAFAGMTSVGGSRRLSDVS
jgi:hypothetical protein